MSEDWKKTEAGIMVPPDTPSVHVDRAEFKVKVKGFAPDPEDKKVWRGGDIKRGRMVAFNG